MTEDTRRRPVDPAAASRRGAAVGGDVAPGSGRATGSVSRWRKVLQAALGAAILGGIPAGLYFGYYAVALVPEMERLAREVTLSAAAPALDDDAAVPVPEGDRDAGPLYRQAVDSIRYGDLPALDDLAAIGRHTEPVRADLPVDCEALHALRQAAAFPRASLPTSPLRRLEARAGIDRAAEPEDLTVEVGHLARALLGAAEVGLAAGRVDAAEADFRAVYAVGRHLTRGAGDLRDVLCGLTLRRMACAGLRGIAEQRGDADAEARLRRHLTALASARESIEDRRGLIDGTDPLHLRAAIEVAARHEDPLWRHEGVVALIRLSHLTGSKWGWLIRRRARHALADLVNDPDRVVAALSRAGLGRSVDAAPRSD